MKKLVNKLNKKGQDLSIGTLILIVLGIVVLVLLILGFSMGWGNLWEKINIFGGTSSIGDIVTACRLAHTSQDAYTLCSKYWTIKNATNGKEDVTCTTLKSKGLLDFDLNCQPQDRCKPVEECTEKIPNPTQASDCIDACTKFTPSDGGTPPSPEKCGLADNAINICKAKNDDPTACNNLHGCQYQ